jgi:transketolase
MRKVLAEKIKKMMDTDNNIVIINADLAKAAGLGGVISCFPDRCFNVGAAEQNMVGVALGLL